MQEWHEKHFLRSLRCPCRYAKNPLREPRLQAGRKEVYVPYEEELDALINGTHTRHIAAFLQCLKETYADPGEAVKIEWKDIDEKNMTIAINHPCKGHYSGTMQVSTKLLSMLSALPHTSERVFPRQLQGNSSHIPQPAQTYSFSSTESQNLSG